MSLKVRSKKKLLFVVASLGGGGAERAMVNLINYLDKDKYDINIVIFEDKRDYRKDLPSAVKVVCLDKRNRWDFFKLIMRLKKIMRVYEPDIVISLVFYFNIVTVLASLQSKRKFKLLLCEHSYPRKYLSKTRLGWLKKWLMNLTYPRADLIITVSKGIEKVIKEDFHIQPEKIKTVYNPIPLGDIIGKSQEGAVHPFFSIGDVRIIIGIGRLIELKRFDRLLRVFSTVSEEKENVYLIILGEGKLREELEVLSSRLKISERVDFVGFKENPHAWMSQADIFVLSSDYEGLPMVLIEAMACGVPVVSTDCPSGPGEIITNGKNGILVPLADEKSMAEAILTLLKNEKLRKNFSEEGRKRAEDFRVEKIVKQYEQFF